MSNPNESENATTDNDISLRTLVRTITLSQGQFSLTLVRCNYVDIRENIVERLHQLSSIKIKVITLPATVKTLYTAISEQLEDEKPPALMVFGLELVKDIDTALKSANQVREEFKKNFPFPIFLWVNDPILQKFIRLATDLENWATIIEFTFSNDELFKFFQQKCNQVFSSDFIPERQICSEIKTAYQDLLLCEKVLEPIYEACIEFALGLHDYLQEQIDSALVHYQQSFGFWEKNNYLQRQGFLSLYIALAYEFKAKQNQLEHQLYWQEAKKYLQKSLDIFEQTQDINLVTKYISKFCEVLQYLKIWSDLEKVAYKSLQLHQNHGSPLQLAQDYGFLAEIALVKSRWYEAAQFAQQALQILVKVSNLQLYEPSLYRFILARAQQGLGQIKEAINNLEIAKEESSYHYEPQLYISILEKLRSLYFEQGQYLESFRLKQEQISIEYQYGFRAFIGANYLHPQRYTINSSSPIINKQAIVAQEITASGRQKDVKQLIERISRDDHKLTVIHGQSGVGKTSILQAGLIPALQQQAIAERDALPIFIRVYSDWVGMLGKCLTDAFQEVKGNKLPTPLESVEAIIEQLRNNANYNLITVLIFDQFEEFFLLYLDQEKRQVFYNFLRICLDIPYVKVILSLREDYLHYLLECERLLYLPAINNDILARNNRYYVANFSLKDAKAVIQSLTEKSYLNLESDLVDKLVDDLAGKTQEIRPIELQIVGAQLQTDKINTLEKYYQFGTKEKLLKRFLEEVLKDCGSGCESTAELILYLLTNANGTRPLKTYDELKAGLGAESNKIDLVLDILVNSGLVSLLPDLYGKRYQLVHDYLADLIRQKVEISIKQQILINKTFIAEDLVPPISVKIPIEANYQTVLTVAEIPKSVLSTNLQFLTFIQLHTLIQKQKHTTDLVSVTIISQPSPYLVTKLIQIPKLQNIKIIFFEVINVLKDSTKRLNRYLKKIVNNAIAIIFILLFLILFAIFLIDENIFALEILSLGSGIFCYSLYKSKQQKNKLSLEFHKIKQQKEELSGQIQVQEFRIKQLQKLLDSDRVVPVKTEYTTNQFAVPNDFLINYHYKITKQIASGGFSNVYLVEDINSPNHTLCIAKHLRPIRNDAPYLEVAKRLFDTEAYVLDLLGTHEQIPKLLDYIEVNQQFYLIQEYIVGSSLQEEFIAGKRLPEQQVVSILKEILQVLVFVHGHDVIHRDIKPSNFIRRSVDGRIVLIDFGAGKIVQQSTIDRSELMTVITVAIGTPGYAPPEQLASNPRFCSDIYAVGIMSIQAITGIQPHELQELQRSNPGNALVDWRQWAEISKELADILDKMVRYNFVERYQSAAEVLHEIALLQKRNPP